MTDSMPKDSTEDHKPGAVIGGYVLSIVNALEHKGIDSEPVLRAAGIEQLPTNDPMVRVPAENITRLFKVCVEATGDPYFGLSVPQFLQASNLHALGYSLLASSTLMDLFLRMERYFRLVSSANVTHVEAGEKEACLVTETATDVCYETEDVWVGFVVKLIRTLYKSDFHPNRIELIRPVPDAGGQPFIDYFGAPVSFGHEKVSLFFNREDLHVPLKGAVPEIAQINDNLVVKYLARLDREDIVMQTKQKIIEFLHSAKVTKQIVAKNLNMSPNNLQLKLSEKGTSYSEIFNEVRKELACSYMQQCSTSVTELAYLLGFTDTSNFARAFKRWTGMSPSDYREKNQKKYSP